MNKISKVFNLTRGVGKRIQLDQKQILIAFIEIDNTKTLNTISIFFIGLNFRLAKLKIKTIYKAIYCLFFR